MTKLIITQPDDWHIHLRDGEFLKTTVLHAAERFGRVIVMPNLKPPVCTVAAAKKYRDAIIACMPPSQSFHPLMTLYLTDETRVETITEAKQSGFIFGCKLYPAGSTTHSDSGVTNIEKLAPVLEKMQEVDLPLLVHGEVTDVATDIFDREALFLDKILSRFVTSYPELRIVLEHITTQEAAQFVMEQSDKIAATITPHHLLMNRNDMLVGGIKPHHYCLPVLKRRQHQEALIKAATSANPKFFLGTDSAPHTKESKESGCGCAGIYSAHAGIELYCEAFDQANSLDKLEGFASFFGADFYKLPRNSNKIQLIKQDWEVPASYPYSTSQLIPFKAKSVVSWKLMKSYE